MTMSYKMRLVVGAVGLVVGLALSTSPARAQRVPLAPLLQKQQAPWRQAQQQAQERLRSPEELAQQRRWQQAQQEALELQRAQDEIAHREQRGDIALGITQVIPGSPAHRAGLGAGDVILAIDGQKVRQLQDLWTFLGGRDSATLTVLNGPVNPSNEGTVEDYRVYPQAGRIGVAVEQVEVFDLYGSGPGAGGIGSSRPPGKAGYSGNVRPR
jgi:membrane-associated protease RseP (regulator of RpoE activity)